MIFRIVRRLDWVRVLEEPRLVLRGLAGQEAVEIVEAVARRPAVERPHGRGFGRRRVVPLAEGRGLVAVIVQDLGDGGGALRHHARIAVPIQRPLGDRAGPDALMVAAGQKRGPRRRADRGRVKGIVADALVGQTRQSRGRDLAAERIGQPEADIVEENDQMLGASAGGGSARRAGRVSIPARSARRRSPTAGRKRQHRPVRCGFGGASGE